MFVVPNFPHLRGIEMVVNYRELVDSNILPLPSPKWRQDLDTHPSQTFKPQPKYYINGNFVKQGEIPRTRVSKTPFPEEKVPRREGGLVVVLPTEPDYEEVCRKQRLFHLLPGNQADSDSITQHRGVSALGLEHANGITPPKSDESKSLNGGSPHRASSEAPQLLNGNHESIGVVQGTAPESASGIDRPL